MSSIHYFQRYSSPENAVTNNTLLLFSRLYNASPLKFELFMNSLTEIPINIGANFNQQERSNKSVPDGIIKQESFKVAIETKLTDGFSVTQLQNHLDSFEEEATQILLALGPVKIKQSTMVSLETDVKNYNSSHKKNISFINTTFIDIITKFREVLSKFDLELIEIIDDYDDYCRTCGIIRSSHRMLTVTCGNTLQDNFNNNIYYDPVDRGYSNCHYLGIYNAKAVRGIGKIENIIAADYDFPSKVLTIKKHNSTVTSEQKQNIQKMVEDAKFRLGWDISKNHKFFCVDKFHETLFVKNTANGLQGRKYFDLEEKLGKATFENTQEIANLLRQTKWTD